MCVFSLLVYLFFICTMDYKSSIRYSSRPYSPRYEFHSDEDSDAVGTETLPALLSYSRIVSQNYVVYCT